jgi:hypothetical protein
MRTRSSRRASLAWASNCLLRGRIRGEGNGTITAFANAIELLLDVTIKIRDYQQQTLSDGTDAKDSHPWSTRPSLRPRLLRSG